MTSTRRDSSSAKRTRMSPVARRRQLIDEGLAMANTSPLDQVTVEAVAESVGVSRALIFHYFDTKQDFHVAMARQLGDELIAATEPDRDVKDPLDVLRGTVRAFVDFVTQRRQVYLGLMRGAGSSDPSMSQVFDDTRSAMVERTLANVRVLGFERSALLDLLVNGWFAFGEATTMRWLTGGGDDVTREQLLDMITVALPSIGAAAGFAVQAPTPAAGALGEIAAV